jgi:hypothetical protein
MKTDTSALAVGTPRPPGGTCWPQPDQDAGRLDRSRPKRVMSCNERDIVRQILIRLGGPVDLGLWLEATRGGRHAGASRVDI